LVGQIDFDSKAGYVPRPNAGQTLQAYNSWPSRGIVKTDVITLVDT